jgi:hypothetical protein
MSLLMCVLLPQWEGAATVDDACDVSSILCSFCHVRVEVCTSSEAPLQVEDRPHDLRGLGKGTGVLLPWMTASFLIMDTFGHNDGNLIRESVFFAQFFWLVWRIFYPRDCKNRDLGFTVAHSSVAPVQL